MILLETPHDAPGLPKLGLRARVISDKAGTEGSQELLQLAREVGLFSSWIRRKGTAQEHFLVYGPKLAKVRGIQGVCEVSTDDLIRTMKMKSRFVAESV